MKNYLKILGSISPYCKNGSNCPGYLIENNDVKILMDCGFGISSRMNMPTDLENLTIIISHLHKDHYADLFALGYASLCYHRMGMLKEKIKVYIPEVKPGEEGYEDYLMIINLKEQYFDINTYNEYSNINIGCNYISFFKTKHSIVNYSAKIENNDYSVVYTGDMGFYNIDEYVKFCSFADLLICESTFLDIDNMHDENHLHAKEAGYIASLANVNTLMLTHFWPEHNRLEYVQEAGQIFNNTLAANEDMVLDLNLLRNNRSSYFRT